MITTHLRASFERPPQLHALAPARHAATLVADSRPEVIHAEREDDCDGDVDAGGTTAAWRRTAATRTGGGDALDAHDAAVTVTLAAGSYVPLRVARDIARNDECV